MNTLLEKAKIIPVVTLENKEQALRLVELFIENNFTTIEVTLRTKNALTIIELLADKYKSLIVGAGTVVDLNQLEDVMQSGAQFAVSPGFLPALVSTAHIYSFPFLPGVSTVSEAMQAQALGIHCLKLFPVKQIGGVAFLSTLQSILPSIKFFPTGGIQLTDVASYLALNNVQAVGLSCLASQQQIKAGDWQAIRRQIAEVNAIEFCQQQAIA